MEHSVEVARNLCVQKNCEHQKSEDQKSWTNKMFSAGISVFRWLGAKQNEIVYSMLVKRCVLSALCDFRLVVGGLFVLQMAGHFKADVIMWTRCNHMQVGK